MDLNENRNIVTRIILAAAVILLVLCSIMFGICKSYGDSRYEVCTSVAVGTVTGRDHFLSDVGGGRIYATYSVGGETYDANGAESYLRDYYADGETVQIYYNPSNPSDNFIGGPVTYAYARMASFGILLGILFVIGNAARVSIRKEFN